MQRREFITLLGASPFAWPLAAYAQQPTLPVIGFVNSASPVGGYPPVSAFLKGLDETGFVDGGNVTVEYHWAEGHYERLPAIIADLVQRKVSVIAATSTPSAVAAKAATNTIPIVFTTSGDPIQLGFASSLNKPGGNFTGIISMNVELASKRLQLMHEALPNATTIVLLVNPPDPLTASASKESAAAATALGLELKVVRASSEQDLSAVFDSLGRGNEEALVIASDPFFSSHGEELGALALRHRVPAIYQYPQFTEGGSLMSYGGNIAESYLLAGVYVGRILKGTKPINLPVQQVTKVELIINLKTANALGINFPLPLLGRADKLIE
jgi:putative tryptophan/tyrosine transport system substrate-binding protein